MANWVRSISFFSALAGSVKRVGNSPVVRSGKSDSGSTCSVKRERPDLSASCDAVAGIERHLGAVGQLAHDIVEDVGRHGGGAGLADLGRHRLGDLEVEVGRLQRQLAAVGAQQHVGQDRDGVAPLDDAVHVAEGVEEVRSLDGRAHG